MDRHYNTSRMMMVALFYDSLFLLFFLAPLIFAVIPKPTIELMTKIAEIPNKFVHCAGDVPEEQIKLNQLSQLKELCIILHCPSDKREWKKHLKSALKQYHVDKLLGNSKQMLELAKRATNSKQLLELAKRSTQVIINLLECCEDSSSGAAAAAVCVNQQSDLNRSQQSDLNRPYSSTTTTPQRPRQSTGGTNFSGNLNQRRATDGRSGPLYTTADYATGGTNFSGNLNQRRATDGRSGPLHTTADYATSAAYDRTRPQRNGTVNSNQDFSIFVDGPHLARNASSRAAPSSPFIYGGMGANKLNATATEKARLDRSRSNAARSNQPMNFYSPNTTNNKNNATNGGKNGTNVGVGPVNPNMVANILQMQNQLLLTDEQNLNVKFNEIQKFIQMNYAENNQQRREMLNGFVLMKQEIEAARNVQMRQQNSHLVALLEQIKVTATQRNMDELENAITNLQRAVNNNKNKCVSSFEQQIVDNANAKKGKTISELLQNFHVAQKAHTMKKEKSAEMVKIKNEKKNLKKKIKDLLSRRSSSSSEAAKAYERAENDEGRYINAIISKANAAQVEWQCPAALLPHTENLFNKFKQLSIFNLPRSASSKHFPRSASSKIR